MSWFECKWNHSAGIGQNVKKFEKFEKTYVRGGVIGMLSMVYESTREKGKRKRKEKKKIEEANSRRKRRRK